jgi:SAM-dependent methyltransferase
VAEFYREICRHYHRLFPAHRPQLEFITRLAGEPPARVVDVASGTGEYVAALHGLGYDAYGIEIDFHMARAARDRHPEIERRLIHGDMLELMDELRGPCSLAYCIGNSLPHLGSLGEVREAVSQMWDITGPVGKAAFQVVNFDRVLAGAADPGDGSGSLQFDLPSLSAATDDGMVELVRRYRIPMRRAGDQPGDAPQYLSFESELRHGLVLAESSLRLLVLTRERLSACIPQGAAVQWHGDFAGAEWSADSPATICVLTR